MKPYKSKAEKKKYFEVCSNFAKVFENRFSIVYTKTIIQNVPSESEGNTIIEI